MSEVPLWGWFLFLSFDITYKKRTPLGPYCRPMPRALQWP